MDARNYLLALGRAHQLAEEAYLNLRKDGPAWRASWALRHAAESSGERELASILTGVIEANGGFTGIARKAIAVRNDKIVRKMLRPPFRKAKKENWAQEIADALKLSKDEDAEIAYVDWAVPNAVRAMQMTLKALGLGSRFDWQNIRAQLRKQYRVMGSKVVEGIQGTGVARLGAIVARAVKPDEPLTIADVTAVLKEAWPSAERYALERIARTEVARVWESAHLDVMKANDIQEVRVLTAAGPSITVDNPVCEICLDLAAEGWTPIDSAPDIPVHPFCRCTLIPRLENADGTHWLPPMGDISENIEGEIDVEKAESEMSRLLRYDPDQPRDENGRWTGTGSVGHLTGQLSKPDGGFTYNPVSRSYPRSGFAVATTGHGRVIEPDVFREHGREMLRAYLRSRRDEISANPKLHFGGWHDPVTHQIYLDLSEVYPSRKEALSTARSRGETAIFDLSGKVSIDVATGRIRKALAAPARPRALRGRTTYRRSTRRAG